jgi:hypothetical protein
MMCLMLRVVPAAHACMRTIFEQEANERGPSLQ